MQITTDSATPATAPAVALPRPCSAHLWAPNPACPYCQGMPDDVIEQMIDGNSMRELATRVVALEAAFSWLMLAYDAKADMRIAVADAVKAAFPRPNV
jgi:hypothetical protein